MHTDTHSQACIQHMVPDGQNEEQLGICIRNICMGYLKYSDLTTGFKDCRIASYKIKDKLR